MSRFLQPWRDFFLAATDASHEFCEAAGLMCLSGIALGRRELDVGRGVRPNLFAMLVGDSSVARKSTSVSYAKLMLEAVECERVGPRDYTIEALLKWMGQKDPATQKGRNKVCLFAEEFGSDLARMEAYAKTMATDFCALYDGDSFEKIRATAPTIVIDRPRVNLFAAAAYQMLGTYLHTSDWLNGYLMRFIYVAPTSTRQKNYLSPPWPKQEFDDARISLAVLRDDIVRAKFMRLPFEKAAENDFVNWVKSVDSYASKFSDASGAMHTYVSRFNVNVQKLALLYQLDEDPCAPVSRNAVAQAVVFASTVLWPSFVHVYRTTTRDDYMGALTAILTVLNEEGPQLKRAIETRFRSPIIRKVMEHVIWSGCARLVERDGAEYLVPVEQQQPQQAP